MTNRVGRPIKPAKHRILQGIPASFPNDELVRFRAPTGPIRFAAEKIGAQGTRLPDRRPIRRKMNPAPDFCASDIADNHRKAGAIARGRQVGGQGDRAAHFEAVGAPGIEPWRRAAAGRGERQAVDCQ